MKTYFSSIVVAAGLALAMPALAEDPHGAAHGDAPATHEPAPSTVDHGAADTHGEDAHGAADTHGDDAHHDPTEYYLGDADGDGTPNWRDASAMDGTARDWKVIFDGEDPYILPEILFHSFNLFIVLALLWKFAARPVGDALKNRALSIRKQLTEAARARDEARQRNEELASRLSKFERELDEMRAKAAVEAKADAEAIVVKAHAEAMRISATAGTNIQEELRRAKASLRAEAVDLAVQLAEATLTKEVQADDQRRLARQFLDSLNTGDSAHG